MSHSIDIILMLAYLAFTFAWATRQSKKNLSDNDSNTAPPAINQAAIDSVKKIEAAAQTADEAGASGTADTGSTILSSVNGNSARISPKKCESNNSLLELNRQPDCPELHDKKSQRIRTETFETPGNTLDQLPDFTKSTASSELSESTDAPHETPASSLEEKSKLEYLLASRRLTLPAFVASMVASWYGGILGVGEYSFKYGISNWLVFGVPYYLAAVIFALFLADRARKSEALTLPEHIRQTYGRVPGIFASAVVFCTSLPAAYLVAFSVLLHVALGLPLLLSMALSALFAAATIWRAGFASVVRSHALQFALMFLGFLIILPLLRFRFGGMDFLTANAPAAHFTFSGGRPIQSILVWYFIALSALVEPLFYQRCFAAKTPRVAKVGLFISILFWALFDFMTTFTGLYARALLTDLPASRAAEAYPLLAQRFLPAGLCGIFFISMAATVLSSLDGCLFISASTLGRDLLGRTRRFEGKIETATKIGLALSSFAAFVLAWLSKSVVTLWHGLGSLSTTTLLLPVLGAFVPGLRMTNRGAVVHMCLAFAVTLFWLIALNAFKKQLLGIEPIFAGLAAGLLVWLCDRLFAWFTSRKSATMT